MRNHAAAQAKASRRRRKRSTSDATPDAALREKAASREKGSPQGEASSRILDGAAGDTVDSSFINGDDTILALRARAGRGEHRDGGGRRGGAHLPRDDGEPEQNWVLWMALSEEEKQARGSRKLYNAKQLAWRKKRREKAREVLRVQKRAKKAAAQRLRIQARKLRQSKLKSKLKAKAKLGAKAKCRAGKIKEESSIKQPVKPQNSLSTSIALSPSTELRPLEGKFSSKMLPPVALSKPLRTTSEPSFLRMKRGKQSHSPGMMLETPSRLQRISISRDNSEQVYKEFNKLLFAQDDHKATIFKAQFRGGNPYIKPRKKKPLPVPASAPETNHKANKLAGKIDRQGNLHCQSRKCGAVVTFDGDRDTFMQCEMCGHLNNRRTFRHIDAPRAQTSSRAKFPPTHADLCREKFSRKLRHRFIDQLNDVIHHIGDSVNAGIPPKKTIWKEFDNTQLRLAHPWKAPAAPGAKYDISYGEGPSFRRTLSNAKSTPAFTLYAKRHQMRFDNDPDSPER